MSKKRGLVIWIICLIGITCSVWIARSILTPDNVGNTATAQGEKPSLSEVVGQDQPSETAPESTEENAQLPVSGTPVPGKPPGPQGNDNQHPADALLAGSKLVREQWGQADGVGNRERSAIYQTDLFKYPLLRVVEKWSGKTGDMVSRTVMVADHLLVAPRSGVDELEFEKQISAEGFTVSERIGESSMRVSFSTRSDDPAELPRRIAVLEKLVEYAEPDYLVWPCVEPNDPAFAGNKLWGLRNLGGVSGYSAGADIDATAAWAIRNDASNMIVAVTDTGIRYDHQDLAPNMWRNPAETADDGIDNDANGLVDDVFGCNAYAGNGNPMDQQGHGTHCAGTIGACGNNGLGMTGVAWNVRLMAGLFLGPYGGATSDAIKVITYARQKGAHVISASWGGGGFSFALRDTIAACANAGIPFVAAAGNSGTDNDALPHYPSSYDLPNIVAVAATDANDNLTGFSCFGRNSVDIAAPGWQIWSCYKGSVSDYRFLQGTSMATPHVSGALALARAHYPTASVEELINGLYRSADKLASLDGMVATGGRLNLYRLLTETAPLLPYDQFDTPFALQGDFATWSGSNRAATREADENSYSPASEARTLWFAWQAPYEGFVAVSTASLGAGQRVVVFSGDARSSLKVVYDSGMTASGTSETVARFLAETGKQYRIVSASDSGTGELFSLKLELTAANDLLSRSYSLGGETFETSWSNRGATAQPFEIASPHAGVGAGHSVWFRWTAPISGPFSLNTEGSSTDTVVAVYTGDPLNPAGFTTIGANDDVSGMLRWSRVDFTAVEGVSYHIAVDTAMGGVPGAFVLRGASPAPPVIASEPADLEIPFGGRGVFSVGAVGTPPLRYQWFKNDEALPGAWQNSLIIDPVSADSLGAYHVVVSNSFGSVTSRSAQLAEKLVAPSIIWKSGEQSLVAGASINLRVEARGSLPLTYQWLHNGVPRDGANTPSLAISSLTLADGGTYECRVSNAAGQAAASMRVTVVASPFDSWQWRLAEMPGPGVAEIKVIDNKAYAVTGGRIMVSTDGLQWSVWMLPSGFDGMSINKLGNMWLCIGVNATGSGRCARSTDGVNWSLHTLTGLPGTDGQTNSPLQHVARVEVFNGRFIGQRARRGTIYGDVYTSTDGIAWTAATLDGAAASLVASGPFAIGSGMIVLGNSTQYGANLPARYYYTTNGFNWTTSSLPSTGAVYTSSKGAMRWNGRFVLSSNTSNIGWVSENGIDWTLQSGIAWPGGIDHNGSFVALGGAQYDGVSVAWGNDPWSVTQRFVKPATGDIISAYCSFNGRVVYGTQRGFLGSLTEATGLMPFGGTVTVPNGIAFMDNRFFLMNSGQNGTPLVSGDGSNWRKMRPWTWDNTTNPVAAYPVAGIGGGYFWGTTTGSSATKGRLPHVMPQAPVASGLPGSVNSIAADGNNLLGVSTTQLYRSFNGGDSWAQVMTAPAINVSIYKPAASVMRSGSRWLLTNAAAGGGNYGFVHYSDDGVTWTKTTAKAGYITSFNGTLYGLENQSYGPGNVVGWKSINNGATWTTVTFNSTNKLANMEVLRLGTFGNALVALVTDSNYARALWFSNDGISWFQANAPLGIQDFATGLGQFVAYMNTGAIVQAGAPPAGGSAPVVRTDYPVHQSAVISGSWVDVTGEAFDPEGGAITLECLVDGQLVGSSGAGAFRFRFRAGNPTGHMVILRATDASGLVGSDELRVIVMPQQGTNLTESAEGRDYLPRMALVEFNGVFYAAGDTGIQRSIDGLTWEPVILPSLVSKLKGLAAGNGSLVAQAEKGVYTTRDGVNWTQVGLAESTAYWIDQPITFSGGRFLVIRRVAGQIAVNYQSSVNGIDWSSASLYLTARQAVIGDNGVMVSLHLDSWAGDKAVWSADGGNNWFAIPGIERSSGQNLAFAMAYGDGIFLIAASDGRVWRSTDGKSWTGATLPAPITTDVTVRHASGRFFVGSSTALLYSAPATLSGAWQALSLPVKTDAVIHAFGRFIARGETGMAWSQDGVIWKNATGGPVLTIGRRLAANGDHVLAVDSNGAAWSSTNGVVWRQDFAGASATNNTALQVGRQMATLGSSILVAGTYGMLMSSVDGGASWIPSDADGQAVAADRHFNRVQVSAGVALATAVIGTTAERLVLRSVNGHNWQTVADLAAHRVIDVAGNGAGTWVAVGANAAILRSADHGLSWQQVVGPTMATARVVAWFNNEWLIYGAVTSGAASRCWSSPDGITWTDRGANGLVASNNEFFRIEGHGRLVVWNQQEKPVATSDGRNWQSFTGYQTFVGNTLYWVAPNTTGFLLAVQAPWLEMFSGTQNGQSWVKIPGYQTDTVWAAILGERLFLFAPGRVVEWSERDLELELVPVPMATLGVADVVQSSAVVRNLGSELVSGPLDVDGWLSTDGFFGDGNDVYLGRIQINAPVIPPGGETAVNISFELPGMIKPGDSRLVVVLDPSRKLVEKNRANNVSISSTPAVRVPQRKLEVLANGNGTVSSDQNAEYYPHGARIAMVAMPGKGARFAGWGGDAVGSLSETLIVMDADKNVEANFVSTSALTVFTRGGGTVEQSSEDGIYVAGTTAELSAAPLPGWTFSGWSGSLTGNQTTESLLMNSNKVVTARFSLGLDAWKNQKFSVVELANPSISGENADADGDGLQNWREWLRGSDPKNRNSQGIGAMRREGNWIVMTYTRMENMPAGHDVRCEASTDLGAWTTPVDERVIGSAAGVETIEARVDVTSMPRAFIRTVDRRP